MSTFDQPDKVTGSSIDIEPPASGRPSGLDEIHDHDDVQPMPFNSA